MTTVVIPRLFVVQTSSVDLSFVGSDIGDGNAAVMCDMPQQPLVFFCVGNVGVVNEGCLFHERELDAEHEGGDGRGAHCQFCFEGAHTMNLHMWKLNTTMDGVRTPHEQTLCPISGRKVIISCHGMAWHAVPRVDCVLLLDEKGPLWIPCGLRHRGCQEHGFDVDASVFHVEAVHIAWKRSCGSRTRRAGWHAWLSEGCNRRAGKHS